MGVFLAEGCFAEVAGGGGGRAWRFRFLFSGSALNEVLVTHGASGWLSYSCSVSCLQSLAYGFEALQGPAF